SGEGAGPWRTIAGWDPLHTSLAKARAAPPCPYVTCVTHVPGLICYLCCRFAHPRGRGLGRGGRACTYAECHVLSCADPAFPTRNDKSRHRYPRCRPL